MDYIDASPFSQALPDVRGSSADSFPIDAFFAPDVHKDLHDTFDLDTIQKYYMAKLSIEQIAALMEGASESGIADSAKSTDAVLLRQAIIAELDAVSLYEQAAASTTNEKLKKLFLDVAREEKVHVGEFEQLLNSVDNENEESVEEGKSEAEEKTE